MLLTGRTQAGNTEVVVFEWSNRHGHCYECGLPAAFWLPGLHSSADERDENGVAAHEKRCAVCAANAAVDGARVARIQPEES